MLTRDFQNRTEQWHTNANDQPVHKMEIVYKAQAKIVAYPFSFSEARGVSKKRISEIELRGWVSIGEVPTILKRAGRLWLGHKRVAPIMRRLYLKFPKLTKLVINKTGRTRLGAQTATFAWKDFEALGRRVDREITLFEERRKATVINGLADISGAFVTTHLPLARGGVTQLLEPYGDRITLSQADADVVLTLVDQMPLGSVTVTANFIQTKNKVNVAYLETVIADFEKLLLATNDNEKAWQTFFAEHGWILANIFPYQVILYEKEAYVGGKTIGNDEGRVVDFLFQNGFQDNYALLEIKTHNKKLLKATPYRAPEAFAAHEDCSGAISQCLDQKHTFLTSEIGVRHKSLDPKVVLIIGRKSDLDQRQKAAFELMRGNQKNVDIVTFDEVLEKIKGLRSILQKGD